ncbi:MAG: DUF2304 domain-containing protein [Thermodesulfobacteriota bacterium]|nr:DUF2304 domain-containing protein [Thermodesulfobacteriota bacterium]
MPIRQKVVAIIIGLSIFIVILELVRRRKLREEYSWLWLLTGAIILTLTLWYESLLKITHLIGAGLPTSTLFLFAIIFLILLCLQFSVQISKLSDQVKNLVQELTILKAEIKQKKE